MTDHQPSGVAPTATDAVGMDWSGSPVEAAVGQLVEAITTSDRVIARAIEALHPGARPLGD